MIFKRNTGLTKCVCISLVNEGQIFLFLAMFGNYVEYVAKPFFIIIVKYLLHDQSYKHFEYKKYKINCIYVKKISYFMYFPLNRSMYFKYDRQNSTKCRKYMKIYMDNKYVLHDIINPDLTSVI